MTTEPVRALVQDVYDLLKAAELDQAYRVLTDLLQEDLENTVLVDILTGINFWKEKLRKAGDERTAFERGEYIVSLWKPFTVYMDKQNIQSDPLMYALRHCVFTLALRNYQSLYRENGTTQDGELYRKTGLCFKSLGDYERALQLLEQARDAEPDSPAIIAELADCYALCGETRLSKVLFREAFFSGAHFVELHFLESEIIRRLIVHVESLGYTGAELTEWIPVHGVLFRVLNVKRELRALEFGKLKQAIFALENEVRDGRTNDRAVLIPRLINHYFWLIDHYINVNEDKARIHEVLLKIKLLDLGVYEKYTM